MTRVEATGIVEASADDLFHFTEWCYNNTEWLPFISKAWIVKLPRPDGLGEVTRMQGTMMGRPMEWHGESIRHEPGRFWAMKATSGLPLKYRMQSAMRFMAVEPRRTQVTFAMEYTVPFPILGWLMDRFFVKKEARRMIQAAVEALRRLAEQGGIPRTHDQLERRKADYPGYSST